MAYNWDDQSRIFELIKSLNQGGGSYLQDNVDFAIKQYDYFREKMKEANQNG